MNKFLAGAAAALLACAAQAQPGVSQEVDALYDRGQREMAPNWRPLGKTNDAAVFIHNDIRKADNGMLAVWVHFELPAPEYIEKEKPYLSTRDRMVVDCKGLRVGPADSTYYAERYGHGAVVWSNRRKPDMVDAVPDSIEEHLIKTVCAPKTKVKTAAKRKPAPPKQE